MAGQFLAGAAQDANHLLVHILQPAIGGQAGDADARLGEGAPVPFLALAQCLLYRQPLGDILHRH